ncbi:YqgE/AlgH family protein [Croceiramulus getboli]|nr:YqgE/AlgH family protein [Flavobacteriaceae bacterium YJPT1-3]
MTINKPSNGRLLIAEPSIIGDVSFNRSVVLLADHSHEGSVGFILNKPLDCTIKDLIPELKVDFKVYNGGPVEQDNLYFIHKVPELIPDSIEIAEGIYWGGHFETVVELIEAGHLTQNEICFFLGYSGWESRQLDQELESHSWIVAENVHKKNIFGKCQPTFWREKMIELGGDYLLWSNAPENPAYN